MIKFSGRRELISLKDVEMTKRKRYAKEYTKRLKKIASKHLNCNLDDNEPNYIPSDLKEGTYRWFLYIFSNLYKKGDKFDPKD